MKITDIETILLRAPITEELSDASFNHKSRDELLVKVHTDEGITGIGESGHYFAMGAIKSIIHEEFRPLLLHKDPLDVEKLWEDMYNYSFLFGRKGSAIIAISGIEIALMDIFGKKVGLPVYKLLGGEFRRRIKAYASGGFRKSKENLVEEMSRHVKNGFTAVKMKV